ncbi:hypothetical protein CPC08DRAFT_452725 [Agrocybe pediades]|nr:hypothetical protein CPC08DRAFT_452725 [Agrocybe pediades]
MVSNACGYGITDRMMSSSRPIHAYFISQPTVFYPATQLVIFLMHENVVVSLRMPWSVRSIHLHTLFFNNILFRKSPKYYGPTDLVHRYSRKPYIQALYSSRT